MSEGEREAREEELQNRSGVHSTDITLEDAFKVLSLAPQERLLSLTFKLGHSKADELVHAMTLISLRKTAEALVKLQTLGESGVAGHLSEMAERHGGRSVASRMGREAQLEPQADALIDLARIFRVLADEQLCDESYCSRAYQVALRACTGLCSHLPRGNGSGALRIQGSRGGSSQMEGARSSPSSLRTCHPSCPSFPSHLEVSISPTLPFHMSSINRDVSEPRETSLSSESRKEPLDSTLSCRSHDTPEGEVAPVPSSSLEQVSVSAGSPPAPPQSIPHHPQLSQQYLKGIGPLQQCSDNSGSHQIVTSNHAEAKTNVDQASYREHSIITSPSASGTPSTTQENTQNQEDIRDDERTLFYSFVILHSSEDADVAVKWQEKLQRLVVGKGATFNQDFAVPGQHTLSCIEDAINNSAFTILLLTQNFNTRMLEVETNSALMNSIEKNHKSNTVIPLLPSENRLPRDKLPIILRTINPLEEGSNFDKNVRKAMSPDRIRRQEEVWKQEQSIREERERRERLREDSKRTTVLAVETNTTLRLLQELQMRSQPFPPQPGQPPATAIPHFLPGYAYGWPYVPMMPPPQHQPVNPERLPSMGFQLPHPNITIQNARCIMIGNDSQMTVTTDAATLMRDSEEEQ
ncbi:hypothetical protein AGOR_G00145460 [Albula goreensis]|uniref:TIR domain-containing protein n=1 Tax=Albula goreensis TaxID=1534307 RepID=A0A8T3D4T8_9TELE|nr:hypothetical protein AGOR_G00145460 [Albula goreensis]